MPTRYTRPLAAVALVLIAGGLGFFFFAAGFICLGGCNPDLSKLAGDQLNFGINALFLGFGASLFVLLLALTTLARQRHRIAFGLLLALPIAALIITTLAGPLFAFDRYPTSPWQARALDLLLIAAILLAALMLLLLCLPINYRNPPKWPIEP